LEWFWLSLKASLKDGTTKNLREFEMKSPLIKSSAAMLALATEKVKIDGPKMHTEKLSGLSPKKSESELEINI
jgi:hypothetical protein